MYISRKITELEAKVLASAYQEDALVKKKKKSKKISEHKERKILDSTEVEDLVCATAVKDYGINDDQKSVDRSEESVILEDLSSSPLESDHARPLKNDVVEATNSRSTVVAGSLRTRCVNVPVRPTSTKKVLALPEWDEDSHPEESGDFWQLVIKHKPTRKKKVLYIRALVKCSPSQELLCTGLFSYAWVCACSPVARNRRSLQGGYLHPIPVELALFLYT